VFGWMLAASGLSVGLFGVLRLTRQFPAATSSPTLLVPFLLPVLALALEAGALVAFSASALRLFRSRPARPFAARASALWPLAGLLAAVLVLAQALPRGTERPGAFANELVESARQSCSAGAAGSVPVPLLGLVVRCDRNLRIEGPMPGVPSLQLVMQSLSFSDDLRRVQISGLDLTTRRSLSVRLRAHDARISGLAPWTRSAKLSPLVRCVILIAIALALGLLEALWWQPAAHGSDGEQRWRRALRAGLGGLPGLAAAVVIITLDQEQAPVTAYVLPLVAALAALSLLLLARRHAPKIFSSFNGF
jgi:hypothetical protein